MTTNTLRYPSIVPSGEGKSVLEAVLRLQGVDFITGPIHLDGSADFARLMIKHMTLKRAWQTFMTHSVGCDRQIPVRYRSPRGSAQPSTRAIRKQVKTWGVADTEVREQIYRHLQNTACDELIVLDMRINAKTVVGV